MWTKFEIALLKTYFDSLITWAILEIGEDLKSFSFLWCTLHASCTIHYVQIYGSWLKIKSFLNSLYLVYCIVLTINISLISLFVLGNGTEISSPCIQIIFCLAAGLYCLNCWNLDNCTPLLSRNSLTTIFPSFVFFTTPYWWASSE